MKPETKKLLHKYGTPLHFLVVIGLIVVVAIQVHWSVALLFAWMGYTISAFATGVNRLQKRYAKEIQALRREQQRGITNFNEFIGTVNKQAEEFKKHGNKCIECEKYPGEIRHGSIHNSSVPNCQLYKPQPFTPGGKLSVPPAILKADNRPKCRKCKEEGLPDLYHHNNCPIHN